MITPSSVGDGPIAPARRIDPCGRNGVGGSERTRTRHLRLALGNAENGAEAHCRRKPAADSEESRRQSCKIIRRQAAPPNAVRGPGRRHHRLRGPGRGATTGHRGRRDTRHRSIAALPKRPGRRAAHRRRRRGSRSRAARTIAPECGRRPCGTAECRRGSSAEFAPRAKRLGPRPAGAEQQNREHDESASRAHAEKTRREAADQTDRCAGDEAVDPHRQIFLFVAAPASPLVAASPVSMRSSAASAASTSIGSPRRPEGHPLKHRDQQAGADVAVDVRRQTLDKGHRVKRAASAPREQPCARGRCATPRPSR